MSEINCNNCAISHFKEMLCDRCDEMKRLGSAEDIEKLIIECSPSVQPDNDMIRLQKEQAYLQGWEEGREALRKEMWEDGRDRLD